MNEIIDKIYRYVEQNNMLTDCERVVVGLSGGADSVCLLMVLKGYIEKKHLNTELYAVHVNHGIRQEAGDDEEFARALCERIGVGFQAYHINAIELAKQFGMSVEEAGRRERYRIFNEACKGRNAKIAVAHHMNDQAETVLMNLARGTSLKGIGGIRPVRDNIIRPLLSVTRAEVEEVLRYLNQPYVTDATNLCNDYTRNSLRNVVIPYMTDNINSHTVENIAGAAIELQQDFDFIESEADKAYNRYVTEGNDVVIKLDGEEFAGLHEVIRRRVIYRAVYYLTKTAKDIYKIHVNAVDALVGKTVGSSADICYGLCAVRGYDDIVISSERTSRQDKNVSAEIYELSDDDIKKLKAGQKVIIQGNIYYNNEAPQIKSVQIVMSLHSNYEKIRNYANSFYAKAFDYDKILGKPCIRKRVSGDRIVINKAGNQRKLKKEFIDRKVPENMRDDVLLICDDAGVLWAVGVRRSERALIDDDTQNVLEVTIQ
ncbi:MAG: tRNA lysidine(34) synthetase TilS [Eubacteriales bacterium]|nr:tRNA lysidine(34) synthetase TilS [Eubacteriales bacterium]